MTSREKSDPGEWRLGIELSEHHQPELASSVAEPDRDASLERLRRPLHVVTVEHFGWFVIGLWTVATRLVELGARPLEASEARHALYGFALAAAAPNASAGYHPAYGGWVHLLDAGLFAAAGSGDFAARLIFALSGLLLIAMTFEMRHYVGRAGALALGAMLAISPSVTWFSRANTTVTPAVAFTLVGLCVFMALKWQPGMRRAAGFGVVLGLMAAADPTSLITLAIFAVALALLGLWEVASARNVWLRMRVWWARRAVLVAVAAVIAVAVWLLSAAMLPGGMRLTGLGASVRGLWQTAQSPAGYIAGLRLYVPPLGLYEFLIVILAAVGAIVIITGRVRSRFAIWCLLWALLSLAFYLWTPSRRPQWLLQMVVPMAMVGAFGVDYLHHTGAWRAVRYPLLALAILTVYVQVLANFVHYAPAAGQAPWARQLSLYANAATTLDTPTQCAAAARGITPADATVFFAAETAAPLRWYLRRLRPVAKPGDATMIVDGEQRIADSGAGTQFEFDYEEGWSPALADLDLKRALSYLAAARVWSRVTSHSTTLFVRRTPVSGPTVIFAP
ncbi:MAG: hypothetical protein ACREQN_10500 [Candidatus Binataceae bacterium]